MPYRNASLTEMGRLRLARCVVEEGWPLRRAEERFQVSVTTGCPGRPAARGGPLPPSGCGRDGDRSSRPRWCPHRRRGGWSGKLCT